MDPVAPETPTAPVDPAPRKTKSLKIHLYPEDAAQVKTEAHRHEISQSEFGRFRIIGKTYYALPDASKLEDIASKLAGIANNINQCQGSINRAEKSGDLNSKQFAAMHKALTDGLAAWGEPLAELMAEFAKLKPTA